MMAQEGKEGPVRVRVRVSVRIGVSNNFKFPNVCKKLEKLKGSRGPRMAQEDPR